MRAYVSCPERTAAAEHPPDPSDLLVLIQIWAGAEWHKDPDVISRHQRLAQRQYFMNRK